MKKISLVTLFLILLISIQCKKASEISTSVEPVLMSTAFLENTKERIRQRDPFIMPAYNLLMEQAASAMEEGPFSVTDKEKLPPSGDKHDYASYSRYWWPDPNKPDGLPYIRRDGETNPQSQGLKESDRQRIGAFGENTEALSLAYYLTGKEEYAEKAAELLRVWFLDTATYMNPNVNHAQCRLGRDLGSKSGVLDGRILIQALEGSRLIGNSTAFTKHEHQKLKEWAADYLSWLTTSELALAEANSKNNHGTYYDVQVMYLALYVDNQELARELANSFGQNRILTQIEPNGQMPEELARTRPLFYSIYNLHAMFLVANMAQQVEVDLWRNEDPDARLRAAIDFIAPYSDPSKEWPEQTVGALDRIEIYPLLQMAEIAYPMGEYLKQADKLPEERRSVQRSNLALPLLR